jgi:hypothetical protein
MTEPLKVPTVLKIIIAIAFLLAMNEIAPGLPQAVLVLVALYLLLRHSAEIATLLSNAVDDFGGALRPPNAGGH